MPDPRDILEIGGRRTGGIPTTPLPPAASKRWLMLWFRCANVYARATPTPDGLAYRGRCPRCLQTINFPTGPQGTTRRCFEVTCE